MRKESGVPCINYVGEGEGYKNEVRGIKVDEKAKCERCTNERLSGYRTRGLSWRTVWGKRFLLRHYGRCFTRPCAIWVGGVRITFATTEKPFVHDTTLIYICIDT